MPPAGQGAEPLLGDREVGGLLAQHDRRGKPGQSALEHAATLAQRLRAQVFAVGGEDVEGDELCRATLGDRAQPAARGHAGRQAGEVETAGGGVPRDQFAVEHQVRR